MRMHNHTRCWSKSAREVIIERLASDHLLVGVLSGRPLGRSRSCARPGWLFPLSDLVDAAFFINPQHSISRHVD